MTGHRTRPLICSIGPCCLPRRNVQRLGSMGSPPDPGDNDIMRCKRQGRVSQESYIGVCLCAAPSKAQRRARAHADTLVVTHRPSRPLSFSSLCVLVVLISLHAPYMPVSLVAFFVRLIRLLPASLACLSVHIIHVALLTVARSPPSCWFARVAS